MRTRHLGWIAVLLAAAAPAAGAAPRCRLIMSEPLPVSMEDLTPVISAEIDGVTARFIVDTGSFFDFLTPAGAAQLKLPLRYGPPGFFVEGIGGSVSPSIATAKTFTVAGIAAKHVPFLVGNNDFGGGNIGLLGQNLFRVTDVVFDFANGVMRFVKPQHCADAVLAYWATAGQSIGEVALHRTSKDRPDMIAKAAVNGHGIEVMFDTGSARTILSLAAAKRAGITPDSPGVVPAGETGGMGGRTLRVWSAPVAKFEIGGEAIEHTHLLIGDIDLPDTGADMLLGSDFFLAHHIYAAYSQNKLYFTYNGGPVFDLNARPPAPAAGTAKSPAAGSAGTAGTTGAPGNAGATGSAGASGTAGTAATTASGDAAGQAGAPSTTAAAQPGTAAPSAPPPGGSPGPGSAPGRAPPSDLPTDAAGFMRRGIAEISRGELAAAIADLTRACALDAADAECRYQRGLAYWQSHEPRRARADFTEAVKLAPGDYDAYLARAELQLPRHRAGVGADLDAVDRLAPAEDDLRLQLGTLYDSIGKYPAAAHQLDLWIEYHSLDIRLPYALGWRCWVRAAANTALAQALADCNRAIHARLAASHSVFWRLTHRAPPGPGWLLRSRSLVDLRLGNLDQAIADDDAALAQARSGAREDNAYPLYLRGLAELRKGLQSQGQADLAAARKLRPGVAARFAGMGLTP